MSDLHLEFDEGAGERLAPRDRHGALDFFLGPRQPSADVLVLAGDIHGGTRAVDWAARHFAIPVVLIGGNHEPYGRELFRVIARCREKARETQGRVSYLERATWIHTSAAGDRARFIGATLWTDFRLNGDREASMAAAQERLSDFQLIKIERGYKLRLLLPWDTVRLHRASAAYIARQLRQPFEGATVVVTHHAPSPRSIAPRFQGDALNPAFASNLEELILRYQPALWIHGHMHDSFDYRIGRTRVVCNPRGYFPDQLNPDFDPLFVAEIAGPERAPME